MKAAALQTAALLCALAWAPSTRAESTDDSVLHPSVHRSVHQHELELHRNDLPKKRAWPPPQADRAPADLVRVVYGYYPFWVDALSAMRWSALTHLAWFSIEMNLLGEVTATHGWPDEVTVAAAHDAGVRVDLTFALFSANGITALCGDPDRRATAIGNMVDLMEAGGADGISVDFEGLQSAVRDDFVTFIAELRAELDARGLDDAEISIAGPSVDWGDAVDLDALLDHANYYFVMGYGYFWSGSGHAGPVGMLRVTDDWASFQSRSTLRSIASYSATIPAAKRRQIIWGVPYYGREWITVDDQLGASVVSHVGAVTYSQSVADLDGGLERLWHEGVKNPWYRFTSGASWHQIYYDDAESLAAKYTLALEQDLGGVGMWALGYDRPHEELWDVLSDTFSSEPIWSAGHRLSPLSIDDFPFHDERDTREGASNYFNYYACEPTQPEFGREWVYAFDVCEPGTLLAAVPEYPDRDPDLHLLSAPDQDACLGRAHTELELELEPGRYYLVVDTWVDMPVEQAGAYELDVDFVPTEANGGCASHLSCDAGSCVCATPGTLDCAGSCIDPEQHDLHCGGCGQACREGEACVAGSCEPLAGEGGGGVSERAPNAISGDDEGCGCRLIGPKRQTRHAWLGAALLVASCLRRRRRSSRATCHRR